MHTTLKPCSIPWAVSPSSSGLLLAHAQDDVSPRCTVTLGGGRLGEDDRTDIRRIEVSFRGAHWARVALLAEREDLESIGYEVVGGYRGDIGQYLAWRAQNWRKSSLCPDPGCYVATRSPWLASVAAKGDVRHYVIAGSEGVVEALADGFAWREWIWTSGHRDNLTDPSAIVASGEGRD